MISPPAHTRTKPCGSSTPSGRSVVSGFPSLLCSPTLTSQNTTRRTTHEQEFGEKEAEKLWKFVHKAAELDEGKRHEGSDLDEFQAHRFLEHFHETLTVQVRSATTHLDKWTNQKLLWCPICPN